MAWVPGPWRSLTAHDHGHVWYLFPMSLYNDVCLEFQTRLQAGFEGRYSAQKEALQSKKRVRVLAWAFHDHNSFKSRPMQRRRSFRIWILSRQCCSLLRIEKLLRRWRGIMRVFSQCKHCFTTCLWVALVSVLASQVHPRWSEKKCSKTRNLVSRLAVGSNSCPLLVACLRHDVIS